MSETPLFQWRAYFKNGEILSQRDGFHFVTDVLPRAEELTVFSLANGDGKDEFSVDLCSGDFFIRSAWLSSLGVQFSKHVESEYPINVPMRPIFFRRTTREFDLSSFKQVSEHFVYAIGWQATVEIPVLDEGATQWRVERKNVKHILYIHPDGKVMLG
jgi:hypothetical protein